MAGLRPILALKNRPSGAAPVKVELKTRSPIVTTTKSVRTSWTGRSPHYDGFARTSSQTRPDDFAAALADPKYVGKSPATLDVPRDFLERLRKADTILLIGHVFPDSDTVGGVLTLARALRLLGKKVDICIDDGLRQNQRRFDREGSIKRAASYKDKEYDLAVAVDVNSVSGIGGAAALFAKAKQKASLDHHPAPKKAEDNLSRVHGCEDLGWTDPRYAAASLQACAVAMQLLEGKQLSAKWRRYVFAPALLGMCTDTGWGKFRTMSDDTPEFFKYTAEYGGLSIKELENLAHTDYPHALLEAIQRGNGPVTREAFDDVFMLKVNRASMKELMGYGVDRGDVMALLKTMAQAQIKQGADWTALMIEQPEGGVSYSFRSRSSAASILANAFGGDGHDNAASAITHGCDLDEARRRLIEFARRERLIQ